MSIDNHTQIDYNIIKIANELIKQAKESRNMSKYFANIHTTDALKKAYKELCLKLHPDKGGNAADFIAMKDEYKEAAKRVAWEEAHSTDEATKKT